MALASGVGSVGAGFPAAFWLGGLYERLCSLGAILRDMSLEGFFEAKDYEVKNDVQEVVEV